MCTQGRRFKYDITEEIDLAKLNTHYASSILLKSIPARITVLDVGCATGYFGSYLVNKMGCTVDGIEYDSEAAMIARQHYRQVWTGNVEDASLTNAISGPYDVVMFPAVLEHLVNPGLVLKGLRRVLAPAGFIIANVPNVAHYSLRWSLLKGYWSYTDYGLLDRTHLRFYTLETARELIENAGYSVIQTQWSDEGIGILESLIRWLPRGKARTRLWLISKFPAFFGYEFIFKARVKPDNE